MVMRLGEKEELYSFYRKTLSAGLLIMLLAFALLIWKPLGKASAGIALVLFALAFIPLELARRTARKLAVIAFREA
jgi:branched-subunit amino acid transport protein AzlD